MKNIRLHSVLFLLGFTFLSFGQDELEDLPCTGTQGLVVNFDKLTNDLVETECDSIQFLFSYIQSQPDQKFAIIAILTDKEDHPARLMALARAELVLKKLVAMGVDENRLSVYTSYHKPPGKDDHHDWPFYPAHFTYEIGVYLQADY